MRSVVRLAPVRTGSRSMCRVLRLRAVDRDAPRMLRRLGRAWERHAEHAVSERGLGLVLLNGKRQGDHPLEATVRALRVSTLLVRCLRTFLAAQRQDTIVDGQLD